MMRGTHSPKTAPQCTPVPLVLWNRLSPPTRHRPLVSTQRRGHRPCEPCNSQEPSAHRRAHRSQRVVASVSRTPAAAVELVPLMSISQSSSAVSQPYSTARGKIRATPEPPPRVAALLCRAKLHRSATLRTPGQLRYAAWVSHASWCFHLGREILPHGRSRRGLGSWRNSGGGGNPFPIRLAAGAVPPSPPDHEALLHADPLRRVPSSF